MSSGYLSAGDLLERIGPLVDARTGLIGPASEIYLEPGNPEIIVYTSMLSDLTQALPHITLKNEDGLPMAGSGSSTTRDYAQAKALCEGLERYCNISYDPAAVITATRDELGDAAIDLGLFARGHEQEYAAPYTTQIPARSDQPMRWVKGHSLTQRRPLWLPFSSVYISTPYEWAAEAFSIPISTGSALAANYERAVVSAALEVMERDALSLTWLQQLPLRRIEVSRSRNPELRDRMALIEKAGIQQFFFDATTDLGFPTAYLLQWAPDRDLAMLVMAACRYDIESAMIRVMDEASSSRSALTRLARQPPLYDPGDFRSFTRLTDGAVYYADPARKHVFDFLMEGAGRVHIDEIASLPARDAGVMLDELVRRFRERDLELSVVDITAPPIADCGLRAVRVVAPQLLPLSVNYNLKYGGTPRLYEAPRRMGHAVHAFEQLNPWPQPFA